MFPGRSYEDQAQPEDAGTIWTQVLRWPEGLRCMARLRTGGSASSFSLGPPSRQALLGRVPHGHSPSRPMSHRGRKDRVVELQRKQERHEGSPGQSLHGRRVGGPEATLLVRATDEVPMRGRGDVRCAVRIGSARNRDPWLAHVVCRPPGCVGPAQAAPHRRVTVGDALRAGRSGKVTFGGRAGCASSPRTVREHRRRSGGFRWHRSAIPRRCRPRWRGCSGWRRMPALPLRICW